MAAVIAGWGWLLTHSLKDSIGATDNDVARWFADQRTPTLTDVADVGTLLGETIVELVAAPIVALAFAAWKRSVVPVVFVALVTAGVGGFYYVGTTLDPRDRPPVKILDPGLVPTHSFPSGHVGTSVALYGSIVVLVWLYLRAARWWVTPLLLLPPACLLAQALRGRPPPDRRAHQPGLRLGLARGRHDIRAEASPGGSQAPAAELKSRFKAVAPGPG